MALFNRPQHKAAIRDKWRRTDKPTISRSGHNRRPLFPNNERATLRASLMECALTYSTDVNALSEDNEHYCEVARDRLVVAIDNLENVKGILSIRSGSRSRSGYNPRRPSVREKKELSAELRDVMDAALSCMLEVEQRWRPASRAACSCACVPLRCKFMRCLRVFVLCHSTHMSWARGSRPRVCDT